MGKRVSICLGHSKGQGRGRKGVLVCKTPCGNHVVPVFFYPSLCVLGDSSTIGDIFAEIPDFVEMTEVVSEFVPSRKFLSPFPSVPCFLFAQLVRGTRCVDSSTRAELISEILHRYIVQHKLCIPIPDTYP
jgi:hypothetical protein